MGHFDALWDNVGRMGKPIVIDDSFLTRITSVKPDWIDTLRTGVEIDINDLDPANDHGGLLGYKGAQVLLFLQNQERYFYQIQSGQYSLPRYHVADCQTLREMHARGQYERYVVTNDKSGDFRLDGPGGESMNARLSICKNCLTYLNYRGYKTNSRAQGKIFDTFSLDAFFAIYSSLFSVLPGRTDHTSFDTRAPLAADRQGAAECSSCNASLPARDALLGRSVGWPNPDEVVCLDCQRKINVETPIPVSRATMTEIASARRKKRPIEDAMTWEEVYGFADSAYAGLLRHYQRQGWTVPEPGVDIIDDEGAVRLQLGLAWMDFDGECGEAVVLDETEKTLALELGWRATTLNA